MLHRRLLAKEFFIGRRIHRKIVAVHGDVEGGIDPVQPIRITLPQRRGIDQVQVPPDDLAKCVLRIFVRKLPQQIQIACHSSKSISARILGIRQEMVPRHTFVYSRESGYTGYIVDNQ